MIDPVTSLAFSMHSNPGVYALLVGSGVSRAAEVPTGWEIIEDLIRQLAELEGEEPEPNPAEWYLGKYEEEPNYSRLLNQLARSPEERNQLLRPYFEPDEEERQRGVKMPTDAHRAIAELVQKGSVKVIVTTNFDRLLEQALEDIGITPTVIASADAAEGALPLAHSSCTILKVHGDYLDTRIKNTPEELAEYDERIDDLLDQILDEYGLIVCGWSGEWDQALISAFERCESRRFTTYWAAYQGETSENADRLIDHRDAEVIAIDGADSFFHKLNEKVTSLQEVERPHPVSAQIGVARLKRYITSEEDRISLHDLIYDEVERVAERLNTDQFPFSGEVNEHEVVRRMDQYESILDILLPLVAHGCYWGEEQHRYLWNRAIDRVANKVELGSGTEFWINLRLYPALLLLYGGGIASVAGEKHGTLLSILTEPTIHSLREKNPALTGLTTHDVIDGRQMNNLPNGEGRHTPLSDHVHSVLREPLRDVLLGDEEYDEYFDRFEYIRSLLYMDSKEDDLDSIRWAPLGRFIRRRFRMGGERSSSIIQQIESEVEEQGEEWDLIRIGAFDGSLDRFWDVKEAADKLAARFFRR